MTLRERFLSLSPPERRVVHDLLVEQALARWKAHAEKEGEIRYRESVTGTEQVVDAALPADALAAARSGQEVREVAARYGEPITALQDGDLSFPEPIEFSFYAIYNFFRKYGPGKDVDDWLIVNQAVSSEPDDGRWERALQEAIDKALERKARR
jgi:hypothetical protein